MSKLYTEDQFLRIFGGIIATALKELAKLEPVQIVRCKDCTHYRVDDTDGCRYCHIDGRTIEGDDYCSWAERKEQ